MPIKALVVDDTSVFRITLARQLASHDDFEVVGAAKNGFEALELIKLHSPDVVVLDLEMPGLDGIGTLKELARLTPAPKCKVVLFSSHTTEGAEMTLRALSYGAVDFVPKPSGGSLSEGQKKIDEELIPLLQGLVSEKSSKADSYRIPSKAHCISKEKKDIVGIGISTGGPEALSRLIPELNNGVDCPVLIVQHMPPVFTGELAKRLDTKTLLDVKEAEEGEVIKGRSVYIAPGGYHMTVINEGGERVIRLNKEAPENSCRPAVDVLFKSLAESCGARAVGIVMTGIGQDGLKGSQALKDKGAAIITQDKESSTVYGMPRFVSEANLSDATVPLSEIAFTLKGFLR